MLAGVKQRSQKIITDFLTALMQELLRLDGVLSPQLNFPVYCNLIFLKVETEFFYLNMFPTLFAIFSTHTRGFLELISFKCRLLSDRVILLKTPVFLKSC
jgi:hypothetical protein